jgi:hypothetical protein
MEINLKPVAIAAAIVGTALLIGTTMGQEQAQADRDEYRYQLEQLESRPFPTVTVMTPGPTVTVTPKPKPAKTIYIERSSDRASRSSTNRASSSTKPSGPLSGWKARYWTQGQEWAQRPKTRAVIMCESTDRVGAISSTGKYHGLYQFDRQTWASYGGLELAPLASQATRAEQNYVAYRLYVGRGWAPWGCA